MKQDERILVGRDAAKGDESAQRLLALVDALTQAIALTEGVGRARAVVGEHDDVYGETIDEMLGILAPAILTAIDVQDAAALEDALGCYLPQPKEGER